MQRISLERKMRGLTIVCVIVVCFSSGCGKPKAGGPPGAGGFAVNVVAEPVKQEKVEEKISLVGTLAADEAI